MCGTDFGSLRDSMHRIEIREYSGHFDTLDSVTVMWQDAEGTCPCIATLVERNLYSHENSCDKACYATFVSVRVCLHQTERKATEGTPSAARDSCSCASSNSVFGLWEVHPVCHDDCSFPFVEVFSDLAGIVAPWCVFVQALLCAYSLTMRASSRTRVKRIFPSESTWNKKRTRSLTSAYLSKQSTTQTCAPIADNSTVEQVCSC